MQSLKAEAVGRLVLASHGGSRLPAVAVHGPKRDFLCDVAQLSARQITGLHNRVMTMPRWSPDRAGSDNTEQTVPQVFLQGLSPGDGAGMMGTSKCESHSPPQ